MPEGSEDVEESMRHEGNGTTIPSLQEMEEELGRERRRRRTRQAVLNTVCVCVLFTGLSAMLAYWLLTVLLMSGDSMEPSLRSGDLLLVSRTQNVERGQIIAFYSNQKLLIKRVIGIEGDMIELGEDGQVYVNAIPLHETYLTEKVRGDSDISYPFQVPSGRFFVLGDQRTISMDSRHKAFGCVAGEQILGCVFFRIWPLSAFGRIP